MTAGEFNELAKQDRVWATIGTNFNSEYGLVEKNCGFDESVCEVSVQRQEA